MTVKLRYKQNTILFSDRLTKFVSTRENERERDFMREARDKQEILHGNRVSFPIIINFAVFVANCKQSELKYPSLRTNNAVNV